MKLLNSFRILKTAFTKPVWQGEKDSHTVVPAFMAGGVQYYEVPGLFNSPYRRALAAASIYEEVQMRVTREYLLAHLGSVNKALSDSKSINVLEIAKYYKELEDRVNWIVSPESIYKLASVVYFDQNESIYDYNQQYAVDKIKLWKKEKVADFFLQEPIKKFIPHSNLPDNDLVTYIETALKMERQQVLSLLQSISKTHSTEDFYKTLESLHKEVSVS